jgi:glycosyltransferase involved in cell wall biosynthesis
MCREKGLELAVDAFLELRKRGAIANVQLHVGGGCGPSDEPIVAAQKQKLARAGLLENVRWFPNVSRDKKIRFMQSLDVFCTPALYGEAFGLYVIEAMAAGVPVVQPRHAAFPELVELTGGGVITEPSAASLAEAIEELLSNEPRARAFGEQGRRAVREQFNVTRMATETATVFDAARALVNPKP